MCLFEKPVKYTVPSLRTCVLLADARDFTSAIDDHANVIITSPPYLNRYDYSHIYGLELSLAFVEDFADLKAIRHSLLRSHIESRPSRGAVQPGREDTQQSPHSCHDQRLL